MLNLSVTDFSRNLKNMLNMVEYQGEEIILNRNKQQIARILPGSYHITALEAMADLYRTIPEEEGLAWYRDSRTNGSLEEVADPWES